MVKHVNVRAIDELDHGIFCECRGLSVQTLIDFTDCSEIYVPGCVLCPVLALESSFFGFLRVVKQTLNDCYLLIQLACVINF